MEQQLNLTVTSMHVGLLEGADGKWNLGAPPKNRGGQDTSQLPTAVSNLSALPAYFYYLFLADVGS